MKHRKVYYYDNELEDEFSGIKRNTITVDENCGRWLRGCCIT